MPIYCVNSANRKQSTIDELNNSMAINGTQPQLSNGQHSQPVNPSSKTSPNGSIGVGGVGSSFKQPTTSLIMAINQFRNSVKDMKETVLIPTRLNDLMSHEEQRPAELVDEEEPRRSSPSPDHQSLTIAPPSTIALPQSIRQHNLYEQFKLLDLIDKIISSDTILSTSAGKRYGNFNGCNLENDDNNNSKLSMTSNNGGISLKEENGFEVHSQSNGDSNGRRLANRLMANNTTVVGDGYSYELPCTTHITDCSLLKIKEKLEYHLVSLKNILSLMSNSADFITRTYLDDIHCGERFDRQVKLCDPSESIRHYYTSNNSTISAASSTTSNSNY